MKRAMNNLAERGGFEPPLGYYPKHAFQACDLNHSSTSPKVFFFQNLRRGSSKGCEAYPRMRRVSRLAGKFYVFHLATWLGLLRVG